MLAADGHHFAEAYPAAEGAARPTAHRGPLRMYLDAGFVPVREAGSGVVVRRALAQP